MTIAATRSGKVEGVELDGVLVFPHLDIPRRPYPSVPAASSRRRRARGTACAVQISLRLRVGADNTAIARMLGSNAAHSSEDSLYLNVWTPACDDAARPVMVWSGSVRVRTGAVS